MQTAYLYAEGKRAAIGSFMVRLQAALGPDGEVSGYPHPGHDDKQDYHKFFVSIFHADSLEAALNRIQPAVREANHDLGARRGGESAVNVVLPAKPKLARAA